MPTVHLPALLRPLAGGASSVELAGESLRAVIDDLDRRHPGMRDRIIENGTIRPDVLVAIGSDEVSDLDTPVPEGADVHILPAMAGGSARTP
jgi:molybdopterin converting factor small subunit